MKQSKKYYNQTEIADLLGVSKATISRYIKKLDVSGIEENKAKMYGTVPCQVGELPSIARQPQRQF
ncbi:helix-turn-helix domain-containing protein [Limosilactobacillus reuteri]|uniref:Helix-turn-helix type 11 domain-containing protein n=1 Tax=Limosilactobacillus reuteri TaxID=1598 RepID=A0A3M6SAF6_LIMRT|nr:helix-turn-helix domain-containing protein [Limosilactobacillus reuteri]MBU5284382.1 helix-turn-helix domain-containing protein [Limosilactobacillus reuteri]MCC4395365.1 helix-turn-helix domain-containing protein [Limosilactobacillus reuteri]MCC4401305.1 helix-turn-helix domain-containing protein [Limosilactobacillus reuteri]RMX24348.1 hypothetical protein C5O77_10365 [Limosilactobacillus reuteri]